MKFFLLSIISIILILTYKIANKKYNVEIKKNSHTVDNKDKKYRNDNIAFNILKKTYIEFKTVSEVGISNIIRIKHPLDNRKILIHLKQNNSNINFTQNNETITFTPSKAGSYQLILTVNQHKHTVNFTVRDDFNYNKANVNILNNVDNLENAIGFIQGQYWIYGQTLNKYDIEKIVSNHPSIQILGFDIFNGLLVEIQNESIDDIHALEEISRTHSIDYVTQRLHEGIYYSRLEEESEPIYPNDYPSWSEDTKENWHLKKINMPKAWAISQGNSKILIGISDGGFDTRHEELSGKIAINHHLMTSKVEKAHIDHGTAVAGVIGAKSHNNHGISGINFNAKLVLAGAGMKPWNLLAHQKDIKLVTSSWALTNHLPASFDPTDASQKVARSEQAFKLTRHFRKIAQLHPEKLFIFSAGNGIGNGKGNNGQYAVDGELHSPSLHLSSTQTIDKLPNVIFVSALTYPGNLSFSSTYGPLVDLAAPAYYKSLASENNFKTDNIGAYGLSAGFKGTSASAPVVAGVASLIYSINDQFTGADVKDILLSSAKHRVSYRFTNPRQHKTLLDYPIPILDAYEAVKLAKIRENNKTSLHLSLPNPYESYLTISLKNKNKNKNNKISGIQTADGLGLESTEEAENKYKVSIDDIDTLDTINIDIADADGLITTTLETPIKVAKAQILIVHNDSKEALDNVKIVLESTDRPTEFPDGLSDNSGKADLFLLPGSYKITTTLSNFHSTTRFFHLSDNESLTLNVDMSPLSAGDVGSIDGTILDSYDRPINDATITLTTTNTKIPITVTTKTDDDGYYTLDNLNSASSDGSLLSYQLIVAAEKFSSKRIHPVVILTGETLQKHYQLTTISINDTSGEG